jgi:hypothetical protein
MPEIFKDRRVLSDLKVLREKWDHKDYKVHKVLPAPMVIPECKDHRVRKDHKVRWAQQERKVLKVLKDHKDRKDRKVRRVLMARKVRRGPRALLDRRVRKVHKVLQGRKVLPALKDHKVRKVLPEQTELPSVFRVVLLPKMICLQAAILTGMVTL